MPWPWTFALPLILAAGLVSGPAADRREGIDRARTLAIPADGATLAADLFIPRAEAGRMPGIVVVHGSERMPCIRYRPFAERLGALGIVTPIPLSPSWRSSPGRP